MFVIIALISLLVPAILCRIFLKKPIYRRTGYFLCLLTGLVILLSSSITVVDQGKIKVSKLFGKFGDQIVADGLNFVNPLASHYEVDVRRKSTAFSNSSAIRPIASGQVELNTEWELSFKYAAEYMPEFFRKAGNPKDAAIVYPSFREAVLDCVSQYSWTQVVNVEYRNIVAQCARDTTMEKISYDLRESGFSNAAAKNAITIIDVKMRDAKPVDERILTAVADRMEAEENEKKQVTLLNIDKAKAERRKTEGQGIANMMNELPKGDYTIEDMVSIIRANALNDQANALQAAVAKGNQNLTFIIGSGANVAVPASR